MPAIEVPRAAVELVDATSDTPPRPESWEDYVREQLDAMTFESDHDVWSEGQRIFVRAIAEVMPPGARVLDCACGDGVGLAELSRLGFDPVGVELAGPKAERARSRGFEVHEVDMHTLDGLADETFDVVMSSHTLEHALEPSRAVASMRRVLRPGGQFHVVLPYPDPGDWNRHVHVAKEELGTHDIYRPDRIVDWFVSRGFVLTAIRRDDYREPEIWLSLRRDD